MNAYEGEARRARTRFSPQIDCDASPNTVLLHRREGESPIHGIWVTWLFLAARDAPHSKKLFDASARIGHWLPLLVALLTDVRETPVSRWPPSLPLRSPCRCATRERAARHTRARRVRLIQRRSLARLAPTAVPNPNTPLTSSPHPIQNADADGPRAPCRRAPLLLRRCRILLLFLHLIFFSSSSSVSSCLSATSPPPCLLFSHAPLLRCS